VREQVRAKPGSYLATLVANGAAAETRINKLFQRFLLRQPTADERRLAVQITASGDTRSFEDLQWLLVNKVEFLFNY
jgi:hypothetical protein